MTEERKQILENAGISVEEALVRFMGNDSLLERMLLKFLEDPTYTQLMEAMSEKQQEQAFQAAHTLKGVCGNLSMDRLFYLLSSQVDLLRQGHWDKAQELVLPIQQAYEAVQQAVSKR